MPRKITYKTSGVDIDKANAFVRGIKGVVQATKGVSVLERKGAFGGLFGLDVKKYKDPVLVSSTDGVGTKLLLAQKMGVHHTVGIDLVAMNVNDILCVGAKPLFFLDYIACGKLDPKVLKDVVKGIAKGCKQSDCSLVGGETAEMPGMYKKDEYDLAGFAVGVVDKKKILDGSGIKAGDRVIGLASSGIHSNGYSLVRKVFSGQEQKKFAATLLKPTKIYVKEVLSVLEKFSVRGMAHNTGGAFYEKLTKILPDGMCFKIDRKSWRVPEIFRKIQEKGAIKDSEMFKTFNMGIGFIMVVSPEDAVNVRKELTKQRLKSFDIGEVVKDKKCKINFFNL